MTQKGKVTEFKKMMEATAIHEKEVWRIRDVANMMGVSNQFIYRRSMNGTIPCKKIGKLLFFIPDEIRKWVNDFEPIKSKSDEGTSIKKELRAQIIETDKINDAKDQVLVQPNTKRQEELDQLLGNI